MSGPYLRGGRTLITSYRRGRRTIKGNKHSSSCSELNFHGRGSNFHLLCSRSITKTH